MYLLWGSDVAASPGHDRRGSVQQVCATLLALLGLPPGSDIVGPPLAGVPPSSGAPADYASLYKPVAVAATTTGTTSAADRDTLAKLRSLGYIGGASGGGSPSGDSGSTRTPASFNNEGLILRDRGKASEAMTAFESALSLDPEQASAAWNLSDMLFAKGDRDRADQLLVQAFARDLPEGTRYLLARAIGYQREGQTDRALKLVNAALQAKPGNPEMLLFRGRYRVEAHDCAGALDDFQRAEQLTPREAAAYAAEGIARACLGDRAAAERAFSRSLQLDPNQPNIRDILKAR
jgi:tetratricopeptide (TPR) repeat protein